MDHLRDGFDFNPIFWIRQTWQFEKWKTTNLLAFLRICPQGAAASLGMDCSIRLHATGQRFVGIYIYIRLEFRWEAVPVFV